MSDNHNPVKSAVYQHSKMQVYKQLEEGFQTGGKRTIHTGMNTSVGATVLLMAMAAIVMSGQTMNSIQQQLKVSEKQQDNINQQLETVAQTELPNAINNSDANMATVTAFQNEIYRDQSALEGISNNVQGQAQAARNASEGERAAYMIGQNTNKLETNMFGVRFQTANLRG